jgi:glucose-6-phosphate 1-dehydrogenase
LIQPLLDAWAPRKGGELSQYAAGSQGPAAADALLAHTGHTWRNL